MDDFDMRDLFAGLAMAGWMGNARLELPIKFDEVALNAYTLADAMIKAREPQEEIGIAAITRRKSK